MAQRLAGLGELPETPLADVTLLCPIEVQEVWAAGVTYLRSKDARMEESDFSATAYDRVYDATRPELFFKSLPEKVVACGEPVGIRTDAQWSVPEPELVLMMNSRGEIAGYAVGNDMSSRDIEGENLLYLPQAKVYHRSCAVGPWVRVGAREEEAREWEITIQIERGGETVFEGTVSVNQDQAHFRRVERRHVSVASVPVRLRAAHRHRHRAGRRLHARGRRYSSHPNLRNRLSE